MPAFVRPLLTGALALLAGCVTVPAPVTGPLAALPVVARVDPRFQSYNIEMVEVTGGRFWAPYGGPPDEQFRQRPPVDLANPRLRQLAAHLGPAYVRISGTWANTTHVALPGEPVTLPEGYRQVLTPAQWRGVIDFVRSVDGRIVTSFAAGAGTRDGQAVWTPVQAQRLLDLTRALGGDLAAAEFYNEPALLNAGGLPADYDGAAYLRDFARFAEWAEVNAPAMQVLGPGNMGEKSLPPAFAAAMLAPLESMGAEVLLRGTADRLDGVSWHFYGGQSPRCRGGRPGDVDGREAAFSDAWLDLTGVELAEIRRLRDALAPGKPLWLTETGQAACGGSPWAAGFVDSFRYLNQLGLLARAGVTAVMHNTLDASDYGLIDSETLEPRANYWAAMLWHQTMGPVVLAAPPAPADLRLYAHCLPAGRGGVGLLALNPGEQERTLALGVDAQVRLMQAADLDRGPVTVNGATPRLAADGALSGLAQVPVNGDLVLPPHAIAFVQVTGAGNPACH